MAAPKLLFLITEDWFFCSHFLDRAAAAQAAGYEVLVATRVRGHGERITAAGLRLIPLEFDRGGLNPWHEWLTLARIVRLYRRERPDLVHHVAWKPILMGTLAARWAGLAGIVNAPVGMGFVFSSSQGLAARLRPLLNFLLRRLLNPSGSRVILENRDDLATLVRLGAVREAAARLIRGAGVDTGRFQPHFPARPMPSVLLVARMLWDKGVGEFVAAARLLRERGVNARFVLVGEGDADNPAGIPTPTLEEWRDRGDVAWWGRREDMPQVLVQADIACLPSYREGLPKSLLEAAAAGLPIVTTDVPGCREVVRHEDNGLLVPARDVAALADALARLIADPALRARMGRRSRERAVAEFSNEQVIGETLAVYQELLQ